MRVVRGSKRLLNAHSAYELTYLNSAGALCLVRVPRDPSESCLSHLWDCLAIQPRAPVLALLPQRCSRGAGESLAEGETGNK